MSSHRFHKRLSIGLAALVLGALAVTGCSSGNDGSSTPPPSPASLHPDGIGPYRFGDSATLVIDGVSSLIGGWDGDSNDGDGVLPHAQCAEETFRQVSWGNLVLFFEVDTDGSFTAWTYGYDPILGNSDNERGLALTTEEGIGLHSSRTDVEDGFGQRVSIIDNTAVDLATFTVDAEEPIHLVGGLAAANDPDALVLSLESAPGCDQP